MDDNADPRLFPQLPPEFDIPTFNAPTPTGKTFSVTSTLPFYYAAIQCVWIYWQVELTLLDEYLTPLGMKAVPFGRPGSKPTMGAVSINFFNAGALYGVGFPGNQGISGFNETEVNIFAYPTAVESEVPLNLTLEQFICGADQTKRIGAYRVWVACDNAVAVAAGRALFFENKFLVDYAYNVPALNNPDGKTYTWSCIDTATPPAPIYSGKVDLAGLSPILANPMEWIDLSYVSSESRVAASRRNFFGTPDTYLPQSGLAQAVTMTYGDGKGDKTASAPSKGSASGSNADDMRRDMARLIGKRDAVAIQVFRSPSVIAEARPYWAEPPRST